jgi:hypothetical protein
MPKAVCGVIGRLALERQAPIDLLGALFSAAGNCVR